MNKVELFHPQLGGNSIFVSPSTARVLKRSGWVADEPSPDPEPEEQSLPLLDEDEDPIDE